LIKRYINTHSFFSLWYFFFPSPPVSPQLLKHCWLSPAAAWSYAGPVLRPRAAGKVRDL